MKPCLGCTWGQEIVSLLFAVAKTKILKNTPRIFYANSVQTPKWHLPD